MEINENSIKKRCLKNVLVISYKKSVVDVFFVFYFQVTLVIGWTLSASLILTPFYLVTLPIVSDMEFDPWFDPAYSALHGPLVSVGVSWIIFVCTLGHGGTFVSDFRKENWFIQKIYRGRIWTWDHEISTDTGSQKTIIYFFLIRFIKYILYYVLMLWE